VPRPATRYVRFRVAFCSRLNSAACRTALSNWAFPLPKAAIPKSNCPSVAPASANLLSHHAFRPNPRCSRNSSATRARQVVGSFIREWWHQRALHRGHGRHGLVAENRWHVGARSGYIHACSPGSAALCPGLRRLGVGSHRPGPPMLSMSGSFMDLPRGPIHLWLALRRGWVGALSEVRLFSMPRMRERKAVAGAAPRPTRLRGIVRPAAGVCVPEPSGGAKPITRRCGSVPRLKRRFTNTRLGHSSAVWPNARRQPPSKSPRL
jgi:hypothetical protein